MLHHKQKSGRWRFVVSSTLVMCCALAWIYGYRITGLASLGDRTLSYGVYPLLKIQQPLMALCERMRAHRMTVQQLRARVAELEQDNHRLMIELVELYARRHDEKLVQELIGLRDRYTQHAMIGAHVMVTLLSEHEHALLVDAGEKAGVELGMVAIADNALVGKVTHVYPWYSKITLVTDQSCKIAAYCAKSGVHCIHEGMLDTHATRITHVHHYDPLEEGDIILSSGQGTVFPSGFALGSIRSITVCDGLWKQATVQPLIDPMQLTHCVLFHKGQQREDSDSEHV